MGGHEGMVQRRDPPLSRMEHELRAGFNGGPGTSHGVRNSMRDSMLPYGVQAGSRELVGMWAPNEGCNAGLSVGLVLHTTSGMPRNPL